MGLQRPVGIVGEIKRGKDIGGKGSNKYMWSTCQDCGKERWVVLYNNRPKAVVCKSCANRRWLTGRKRSKHPAWQGGKWINSSGYLYVSLDLGDPFYSMTDCKGYVPEHRLIVARKLGRSLLQSEIVHHMNGIKTDNRDENLFLTRSNEHRKITGGGLSAEKCERSKVDSVRL